MSSRGIRRGDVYNVRIATQQRSTRHNVLVAVTRDISWRDKNIYLYVCNDDFSDPRLV